MATKYRPAPEVGDIARQLISSVSMHRDLTKVHIEYVFRDEATHSKGRIVLGRARKITGLNAFLRSPSKGRKFAEPDAFFLIEIAHDCWEAMEPDQRRALVDHELCHCVVNLDETTAEVIGLGIRGHDVEEFSCIIDRHGLWGSGLARMGSTVAQQLVLAVDEVSEFLAGLEHDDDQGTGDGATP